MTATIIINQELNGIEVKFNSKPNRETLDSLKSAGFRWHSKKKVWYAKNTPERVALAEQIAGGEPVKATAKAAKAEEKINLDDLGQNPPRLFGAELAKAIREDLKHRGVKGVTVRARRVTYETGITVTIKATADDIASVEEYKARYPFYKFAAAAESCRGVFSGKKWLYAAEWEGMTEEEKQAAYNSSAIYALENVNSFSIHHKERTDCPELTTNFWKKCNAIFQIANQWNYNNSDSMTDYFDIGYFLDIDLKKPEDFTPRETMTEAERLGYEVEIEAEKAAQAAAIAKMEQERKEAEERRKAYEKKAAEDRTEVLGDAKIEDIAPVYLTALTGGIGKECNLAELEENAGAHTTDAVITRRVTFSNNSVFETFCNYFMEDWDFCAGMGGTGSDDVRLDEVKNLYQLNKEQRESVKFYACNCIGVYVGGDLRLVIDPQGYNYPRYCYLPIEATTATDADEEAQKQRKESEEKAPFYFPAPVTEQAGKIEVGQQITIFQDDGWNLADVCAGRGMVTAIEPGSYAQHKGVYISLSTGKKQQSIFIRDSKKCLIYAGIKPLPEPLIKERINDRLSRLLNSDEIFPRILDYYGQRGEDPILDTIQR